MASSMDCSGVFAAERGCDCDEGVRCPNERNPIFFMQAIYGCPERLAIADAQDGGKRLPSARIRLNWDTGSGT
jgi:hypothetical protein